MSKRIDQFCQDLRIKLTDIDNSVTGLKAKIDSKAQRAEQDVRDHLDGLHRHLDEGRAKIEAEQSELRKWADNQKTATSTKVAEWKAKRETAKLQHRADDAERYATVAKDVALAALDEAELAALEAWVARQDVSPAQAR